MASLIRIVIALSSTIHLVTYLVDGVGAASMAVQVQCQQSIVIDDGVLVDDWHREWLEGIVPIQES